MGFIREKLLDSLMRQFAQNIKHSSYYQRGKRKKKTGFQSIVINLSAKCKASREKREKSCLTF